MLEIKEASKPDIKKLSVLYDSYRVFYKQSSDLSQVQLFLEELIQNQEVKIFFASKSNQIIGFVVLHYEFSGIALKYSCVLKNIYVSPEAQGDGVALALIQRASADAIAKGATRFRTRTAHDNLAARKTFERFGFVRDEHFIQYEIDVGKK
jgi:ribosomal protein S18 acetylase RimI-like enzyme